MRELPGSRGLADRAYASARKHNWRAGGVILTALALTACAHAPQPRIVTKEVRVPIVAKCAPDKLPEPTAYADDQVALDSDIFELVRSLLIGREQRKISELNLRSALEGCRG